MRGFTLQVPRFWLMFSVRFDAYVKAAQQFSIADAQLMNKSTVCAEIDRVLTTTITRASFPANIRKRALI